MKLEALNVSNNNFRVRSEAVVYNKDGILCVYEDGYILFPGGGTDQGETPLHGVIREAIEEADTKLLDIEYCCKVAAVWNKDNPLCPGFIGELTHFFTAFNGGTIGTEHHDRENFEVKPFDEVISFIKEVMNLPDQSWGKQNNLKRIELIELVKENNIRESVSYNAPNYQKLTDEEHDETQFQSLNNSSKNPFIMKAIHHFASNKSAFFAALSGSKIEKLHGPVDNTELGGSESDIEDKEKVERVKNLIANKSIDRPIVLRHNKSQYLLAGNTRATLVGPGVEAYIINV